MINTWVLFSAGSLAWLVVLWFAGMALRRLVWRWLRRKSSNQVKGELIARTPSSRNSDDTSVARYRFTDHKGRVRNGRQAMAYTASISVEVDEAVDVTYCRYAPGMNFLTAYAKAFVIKGVFRHTPRCRCRRRTALSFAAIHRAGNHAGRKSRPRGAVRRLAELVAEPSCLALGVVARLLPGQGQGGVQRHLAAQVGGEFAQAQHAHDRPVFL